MNDHQSEHEAAQQRAIDDMKACVTGSTFLDLVSLAVNLLEAGATELDISFDHIWIKRPLQ